MFTMNWVVLAIPVQRLKLAQERLWQRIELFRRNWDNALPVLPHRLII
jgi:hypothetical protein